jgi:hypothetical protein
MIVRICRAGLRATAADEYAAFLTRGAIPDYRSIPGNLDVMILRCDEAAATRFPSR